MKRVLLVHQEKIQHYRVPIYNYLSTFLKEHNFILQVVSEGVEDLTAHELTFNHMQLRLTFRNLRRIIKETQPDAVIFFVNLKNSYLFPLLFYLKLVRIKLVYWGHAINLQNKYSIKRFAYKLEHFLSDAIILYADYLRKYVSSRYHKRIFVANNTLNTTIYDKIPYNKEKTLAKFGIKTKKNIICMGRMQRRKRIKDLLQAYELLNCEEVGLILVGPDIDQTMDGVDAENIIRLGPVYGADAIRLLKSCDIFCLPGHVGLSIVDAFYCGLPLVTEDVDHAPEIAYLRHGVNGFMVTEGDIGALASKLELLLRDDHLRARFSEAAKAEVQKNANINVMCAAFRDALQSVVS